MGVKKKQEQIPEPKLIKAMRELEGQVEKGDALEDQDPEGGLGAEGEPLSSAARGKKGETRKSRAAASSSSSSGDDVSKGGDDDDADLAKMLSASDVGSDNASSYGSEMKKRKKKTTKKSVRKADDDSSSSDAGSEDDDSSDDDSSSVGKSFRQRAEADEKIGKAIVVNEFLDSLVDQLSLSFMQLESRVAKSLKRIEQSLAARIDNRVAKSIAMQQEFNGRLAKGISAIGNSVQDEVVDMIKSFMDSPAPAQPRGKAVLSKSEVNQPPWSGGQGSDGGGGGGGGGGSDADIIAELKNIPSEKIGEWMFAKAANNQLDPQLILVWEADRYAVEALPAPVRKALANDLIK